MRARRWMLRGLLVPAMLAGCGSESGDEANGREGPGGGSGVVGPTVSVKPGETVVVASDTCAKEPAGIFVEGELVVPDDADIEICARFILVQGGGRLRAGTEGAPFVHKLTITLSAPDAKENVMEMGTKFIGAMGGGVIDLHGSAPATAWSKLAGPVAAGATSFDVLEATGWKVGDEIVVASSTVEGRDAETFRITGLRGTAVTVDHPLAKARIGTLRTVAGREVDSRTEVGVLTRNVLIRGDERSNADRFGGHVMIMPGGKAFIEGVELQRMGQFDHVARYPIHWHLAGDVTGQYVKRSTVNRSFQRGITIHGVQHVLVQDNIVFDTPGHNFLVETPDTVDNVWDHNLGLVTRIANFTEPTLSTQGDAEPANYWIRSAKNTFTRNVAGGSLAHGYWFDATAEGGLVFRDNVAHSSLGNATDDPTQKAKIDFNRESGLFVQAVMPDVDEPDPARPWYELLFERTVLFQNSTDMWPQDGAMRFKDSVFADSPGNAIVGEGCYATFEAPFFAGPSPTTVRSGVPLHLQYSGKLVVLSPTFVGYQGILTSNDIAFPYQADFVIGGATFVDVPPGARTADGFSLLETRDDTFLPKGFYVPGSPALVVPTSTVFTPGAPGDPAVYKNATRLAYATLAFGSGSQSTMAAGGMTATRSDGVAYSGHGQGIDVVTNANYAYRLSRAPANGAFTVRLYPQGSYNQLVSPPAVDDVGTEIAIPLAAAPSKVQITGGAALTAAASLVAFRAAPKTSYFYDGASKMLTVRATFTSLSVQP